MGISLRGIVKHIVIMLITIAMELNIKDSFVFIIIFSSASPHIPRNQQVALHHQTACSIYLHKAQILVAEYQPLPFWKKPPFLVHGANHYIVVLSLFLSSLKMCNILSSFSSNISLLVCPFC